ncbi:unnamed protein product [Dicrocoelium dendriticum]|nr:unnamed protein product [Dicrocoelium dendriticum]
MVNRSISQVLEQRRDEKDYIPVQMEIGELGITVWAHNPTNGDVDKCSDPLLRHSFPQIVSCGRRTDGTNYLAYIVGQEMCNVAKEFNCYVFQAASRADSKFLINAIAQGFDRTHWTL